MSQTVQQALRYSMPPKVRGSFTCASILNTAPTVLDLTTANARETPRAPAAAIAGSAGAVTYGYKVCAVGPGGKESAATAEVTVANGNATLSATNYVLVTWMEVDGAEGYTVYRTTGTATYTTGLIKRVGVDAKHTTAGYIAFMDTGLTRENDATAPSSDVSYTCDGELPHYFYIENTGSNPMLVTFVKAPNSTVAAAKAELVLEESVGDTVFARRFVIAASMNRMISASHGERWLAMEGSGGATSSYVEVA